MMNKIITTILAGAMLTVLFAVSSVHAQATAAMSTSTTATTKTTLAAARLPKIISRGDTEIAARLASLNTLSDRIQAMKNVSVTEKTAISTEVQTNISGLIGLKSKIDGAIDGTMAITDEKTIFGSYRIYALVMPQGYIAASADRIATIAAMMNSISAKLQTRITADQTAGKNVAAMQSSLADLNAKVTDATNQGQSAQTGVASLTPDQGNAARLSANTAALKAARAQIKIASQDLAAARTDAKSIIQDLKNLGIDASVGASASASTTAQ